MRKPTALMRSSKNLSFHKQASASLAILAMVCTQIDGKSLEVKNTRFYIYFSIKKYSHNLSF